MIFLYFYGIRTTPVILNNKPVDDKQQLIYLVVLSAVILIFFGQFIHFLCVFALVGLGIYKIICSCIFTCIFKTSIN